MAARAQAAGRAGAAAHGQRRLEAGVPVRSVFKMSCLFCGLDPGDLKFATVRTHKQHICF